MSYDAREGSTAQGEPVECYRFVLGSSFWRKTSADQALSITEAGGATAEYAPAEITRDEAEYADDTLGGPTRIKLPASDEVAQLFVPGIPVAPVSITIFRTHRDDGEVIVDFDGEVVSGEFQGADVWLTCLSDEALLARPIPIRAYGNRCQWALYGPGCDLDKASFATAGTVSDVSGATVQATNFGTKPDGWFTNGWVERANGERRFIVDHAGEVLTLMSPFFGLPVGELVTAFAGCDRSEATCAAKFSNLARHLGFPTVPARNVHEKGLG